MESSIKKRIREKLKEELKKKKPFWLKENAKGLSIPNGRTKRPFFKEERINGRILGEGGLTCCVGFKIL